MYCGCYNKSPTLELEFPKAHVITTNHSLKSKSTANVAQVFCNWSTQGTRLLMTSIYGFSFSFVVHRVYSVYTLQYLDCTYSSHSREKTVQLILQSASAEYSTKKPTPAHERAVIAKRGRPNHGGNSKWVHLLANFICQVQRWRIRDI